MQFSSAYASIQEDLGRVEECLASLVKVDSPWLAMPLEHVVRRKGKRLRPALTLLAGQIHQYNLDLLLPAATAVELLHTASLVHDDTVDDSATRRGSSTVHTLWDKATAVLLGDYLFANAADLICDTRDVRVIKLFAQTLMKMTSSELEEPFTAFDARLTRQQYYRRIGGKTASLFSMASESGALLSQAPEGAVKALRDYGYDLGLVFQIVDDILDFTGEEEEMGKPVGSDLRHGILTLPAILLVERYPQENPVQRLFEGGNMDEDLDAVLTMIRDLSLIGECYTIVSDLCNRACAALECLPHHRAKQILLGLTENVARRRS